MCVLLLLICWPFWFAFWCTCEYNFISFLHKIPGQGKVNCMLWFMIFFPDELMIVVRLLSITHRWIVSINWPKIFLLRSGIHPSIFQFPKSISYPQILAMDYLCISLSTGLLWIGLNVFWKGKILPGQK